MMTKRPKKPHLFERFADELAKGGGIDRLILFGTPATSDDISAGEFVIDPVVERWLDAFDAFENADKSKLVALMKSGAPLPNILVPHIGDLLDRWTISRPNHRIGFRHTE
jgi:hypothetical protein